MKQTIESVNKVNSLFTDLEPLLIEHFRRASAICDLLERHSAMLGLTGVGQQPVEAYTPEHADRDSTQPHLALIRGGR